MANETIAFSANEMSKLGPAVNANRVVGAIQAELGSDLLRGNIMVVPVEGGAVLSRERVSGDDRLVDFVDIRVLPDSIAGTVHGHEYRKSGDALSAVTAFRHVLGMAEDIGVSVVLPANHQTRSLK